MGLALGLPLAVVAPNGSYVYCVVTVPVASVSARVDRRIAESVEFLGEMGIVHLDQMMPHAV
jgi:hypothetical protein